MAVTVASFKVGFPEFIPAGDTLIANKLAAAVLQVDASVWGSKTDLGVELTTAHLLALSPLGQSARLVNKDGSTIYERRLVEMMAQVTSGYRVL